MLVPSDMVLKHVCLVILQLAACSSRATDGSHSGELSKGRTGRKGQISKYIIPLLDSKARKNDIKVQVVPYYNYKSNNKRGRNVKQSVVKTIPLGDNKNKKDLPVAVILADPKYMKRVNKVSSDISIEHNADKNVDVKLERKSAPFWESVEDVISSEEDSRSDSSLTIELKRNIAEVSNSEDSVSESDYKHTIKELKAFNSIDDAKSSEYSESSENVKPHHFARAAIEKYKHNDNIVKHSNKHGDTHIEHRHVIKPERNYLRPIIKVDNIPSQKHKYNDIAIRRPKSSEELIFLKPLKDDDRSKLNRRSHDSLVPLDDYDNKDKHSNNVTLSSKSSEDFKLSEVINHDHLHVYEQNNLPLNNSEHEKDELHKNSDSLIKSAISLESLEENIDGIFKPIKTHEHSHINQHVHDIIKPENDSNHEPIHEHTDDIIRQGKSSENLESHSAQIDKRSDDISNRISSEQEVNTTGTVSGNSKFFEDSANLDISDNINLQGSRDHQEDLKDNNTSIYLKSNDSIVKYYEDVSDSADEYDISENSSKDESVERNGDSNLEEEISDDFVTTIPLADNINSYEEVEAKVEDLVHPQLSLKESSDIPEVEGQSIVFIKGGKLKKHAIQEKSDERILLRSHKKYLNPVKNDYEDRRSVARSGHKDNLEEIDYRRKILDSKDQKDTDSSSDENSIEKGAKIDHISLLDDVSDAEEYSGKQIFDAIKSYIKKAHDLNSKSYNLSFLFSKR